VAFLETHEASGRKLVARIPLATWVPEDRSSVLSAFFASNSHHFAVVVHLFKVGTTTPTASALIVHPGSGRREIRKVDEGVTPGTPVFWEDVKGTIYVACLRDQVVESRCRHCFGTTYRLCDTCAGQGRGPCSKCAGSGKFTCGHCSGSGRKTLNCTICAGTGRYADSGRPCKKCGGSGTFEVDCRSCGQTGRWNCDRCRATGTGPCDRCNGALVSKCSCRPSGELVLRPLTSGI